MRGVSDAICSNRLNVISITLPPLRKRREDIAQLARHFLDRYAARRGRRVSITDRALECLRNYRWTGNVRELENVIERTIVLLDDSVIDEKDLPADLRSPGSLASLITPPPSSPPAASSSSAAAPPHTTQTPPAELLSMAARALVDGAVDLRVARDRFEREYLIHTFRSCGGSVTEAARRTAMSRRNLYEKIEKTRNPP